MRAPSPASSLVAATLALALAAPVRAELRISDLEVFLNDHEVTVHVVLLGVLAEAIDEGIQSGIPVHVRFTIQLWQYNPYWRDQLLVTKVLERNLAYNVVTKEFKIASLRGEERPVFATRDLRRHRSLRTGSPDRVEHHDLRAAQPEPDRPAAARRAAPPQPRQALVRAPSERDRGEVQGEAGPLVPGALAGAGDPDLRHRL